MPISRSLLALGHDILHRVFHFEGKMWRTVPELFFFPGRLTRRYIDGERAKFVSPMALFLFTAFAMFALFSFTGGALLSDADIGDTAPVQSWKEGNQSDMEATEGKLAALRQQRDAAGLSEVERAKIEAEIARAEAARDVMDALGRGDFAGIARVKEQEPAHQDGHGP